jgi:hypothetical protein
MMMNSGTPSARKSRRFRQLSERLDHTVRKQDEEVSEEQLKYLSTALIAETSLRHSMYIMNNTQLHMKNIMEKSRVQDEIDDKAF